jgi:type I restriction enzyme S subunit
VIRNVISANASGTTRKRITRKKLEQFKLPLPPLAEQKVIADKLNTLLAQVETTKARLERIPQILKTFRQSVLAAAVSGKLTEEWRFERELENISFLVNEVDSKKEGKLKVRIKKGWDEKINLYDLPDSWAWISNYKLAKDNNSAICAGPFGTIFKAKDFRDEGIPIIFLRHVKETGFNQKKPNFMDIAVWEEFHQEYSVFGGELLVTKLGDPPGESCIYPSDIGTAMVTPDVLKMSVDNVVSVTDYLMYFFNSPIAKKMVRDLAFGATRLRIDIAMFKNFPIPLPSREEQTEIVRRVEELFAFADSIEQKANAALARVNNLTQSILAKAFRGELTVDWRAANPELISGENSAAALLEKIKAEREAMTPKKKTRARKKVKA